MAEDDVERRQWQTLLEKVEEDMTKLENVRSYLRGLLGKSTEEKAEIHAGSTTAVHTGTLPTFRKGDFFGLSQSEAGYRVLERAGGSLTTDEILSVLTESGYDKVGGQEPKRTLYVSLCRSRKLVLVAPNTFDLAERRPQVRKTKKTKKEEKVQSEEQAQVVSEGGEVRESK